MKTLYLECNMGAAGDMLAAALLELHPDAEGVIHRLNQIGLSDVRFSAEPSVKCGVLGTHLSVLIGGAEETDITPHRHGAEHHHEHSGLHDIEHIVSRLTVPQSVRENILAVYQLIAEAESFVHGCPVEQVHFHEVGALDAISDITAVCLLLHELAPDKILASPVHLGGGSVECAHGILPVPAPATARLLRDIPCYSSAVQGELCTPTGAALLRHFVEKFCFQPMLRVNKIGYGMGRKDFAQANCVRAMLGESKL